MDGQYGLVVKELASELEGPGSSLETTDFLTNSCGQATNAPVSLFSKQYRLIDEVRSFDMNPYRYIGLDLVDWYQLASRLGVRYCAHCSIMPPSLTQESISWP